MRVLALESSGLVAFVAVLEDDKLIGEFSTNFKKTHSQTLSAMLDNVLKMLEMDIKDIDAIAVSGGPGSFTGLRIGSATAKGFALALNKPVINVPTVDGIAYNLYGTSKIICPIMDARRNQVYTGLYTFKDGDFKVLVKEKAVGIDEIIEEVNGFGQPVIFLGDGVPVHRETILEKIRVECHFAPAHLSNQRAGAVAALGKVYYEKGITESGANHKPNYLRMSQAERELKEKNK